MASLAFRRNASASSQQLTVCASSRGRRSREANFSHPSTVHAGVETREETNPNDAIQKIAYFGLVAYFKTAQTHTNPLLAASMPGLEINSHGIPAVDAVGDYLQELLDDAESIKPERTLEPILAKADFDDIYGHVARIFTGFDDPNGRKLRQYAIVETAARAMFGRLIVSVRLWGTGSFLLGAASEPPLLSSC